MDYRNPHGGDDTSPFSTSESTWSTQAQKKTDEPWLKMSAQAARSNARATWASVIVATGVFLATITWWLYTVHANYSVPTPTSIKQVVISGGTNQVAIDGGATYNLGDMQNATKTNSASPVSQVTRPAALSRMKALRNAVVKEPEDLCIGLGRVDTHQPGDVSVREGDHYRLKFLGGEWVNLNLENSREKVAFVIRHAPTGNDDTNWIKKITDESFRTKREFIALPGYYDLFICNMSDQEDAQRYSVYLKAIRR